MKEIKNCKHGLMEGTCAYCTGLITKPTPNEYGDGSTNSLQIATFERGSTNKAICSMRTGFELNNYNE